MWYVLIAIALIIVAVLLLRLRLRAEVGTQQRWLFVGLGRTGIQADFVSNRLTLRWAGLSVYSRPVITEKPGEEPPEKPPERKKPSEEKEPREKKKPSRRPRVTFSEFLDLVRRSKTAVWTYIVGILKAITVEQLEAEIEAGFEEPHITGQVFGYYQAALAAVPAVVGRVNYTPDYTGASFEGAIKASIALPLYKWLYRSIVLLWQLPIRDIVRMTIGSRKGEQDVE
jgi:hypothetical protein